MTLFPVLVISLCVLGHVTGRLELVNNGYEGLTVVIKENVKEDSSLVPKIKESVKEFSSKMYIATKNRAYIRDVAIVLPKSWTKENNVTDIPSITSNKQIIIIESRGNSSSKSPYVTGNVECGKGGRTMKIAAEFFLSDEGQQLYGSPGNVLLHEWSHLRWGLFDEYPSLKNREDRRRFIEFYYSGGEWQPVRCTREVAGERRISCAMDKESMPCGPDDYPDNCKFCPRRLQQAKASLLYGQYLPSVHTFCDKDSPETDRQYRHNSDAKNKQNAICDGQSAWEVMRTHEDFAGDANPPGSFEMDTTPTFRVMRRTGRYMVFVLDVSGSMKTANRLEHMQQAVTLVVKTLIETGIRLGMVEFSNSAQTLAPLTQIQDSNDKIEFIQKIPKVAAGGTSIGAGLKQALQILHGIDKHQCEIILITDGENTDNPDIVDVKPNLIAAGVVVHTIAVMQGATNELKGLSEDTGGTALTYLGTQDISFADTMYQAAAPDPAFADHTTPERLHSKSYSVTPAVALRDSFAVDDGLGNSTTITVMTTVATTITLTLTGPANFRYTETRTNTKTASFELGDQTLVGEYDFEVTTDHPTKANVMITSKPTSPDSAVLRVTSWLSDNLVDYVNNKGKYVFAEVRKGNNPVLDADVTAILESDTSSRRIHLTDTGTGADKIKDDGIYTGGILNDYLDKNGRYNIKVVTKGDNSTFTWSSAEGSRASTNPEYAIVDAEDVNDEMEKKLGIFNRLSLPGEITVVNYDSQVGDITPPAKIQDLQTDNVTWDHSDEAKSVTFIFSWTSVGDDMDVGQATRYDMVLTTNTTNTKDIDADKTNRRVNMTLMTPSPSGQLETFNLTLTEEICNGTCTVFITAYDESGNKGPWSNMVFVDVNYPDPVPPEPETTEPPATEPQATEPVTTTKTSSTGAGLHVSFMSIGLGLVCVLLK